jgi:probable F420-dependent oxidoreductase
MKIDAPLIAELKQVVSSASRLEQLGYDGLRVAELNHDPFLTLTLAAEVTERIELITSVAVAFSRNPMSTAQLAHDLNAFSDGRFVLGLGTQVKAHITRRFGMPWHDGPAQMREFIEALQAIFDHFYLGDPLAFSGDYYEHSLLPKPFKPNDLSAGRPPIFLSATGPMMTRVAAETADGLIMHPFSTEAYVKEVYVPTLDEHLTRVSLSRDDFVVDFSPLIATGDTEEAIDAARQVARERIAFYGSTRSYQRVLAHHGWEALQPQLNTLMKQGRVEEMAVLIDDAVFDAFVVSGTPDDVGRELKRRYGNFIDRMTLSPEGLSERSLGSLIEQLKSA